MTLAMLALGLMRDELGERLKTSSNCSSGGDPGVMGDGTAEDQAVPESGDRADIADTEVEGLDGRSAPCSVAFSVMEVLFNMFVNVAANSAVCGSPPEIGAAGCDARD